MQKLMNYIGQLSYTDKKTNEKRYIIGLTEDNCSVEIGIVDDIRVTKYFSKEPIEKMVGNVPYFTKVVVECSIDKEDNSCLRIWSIVDKYTPKR